MAFLRAARSVAADADSASLVGTTSYRSRPSNGPTVFAHACKMGLEGIVSKRKNSTYRSGRSPDWLKSKNPACAAVKREAEEDWGR
jgi:ATP-dependent DNA ligase